MLLRRSESCLLLCARLLLVFRPPLVIGHAVDDLARFGIGEGKTALSGLGAVPFRQAVAAEACQIHQIDILDIRPLSQMRHETAKRCSLELGAGLVVHRILLLWPGPMWPRDGGD